MEKKIFCRWLESAARVKLLSWNILQGGGRRVAAIVQTIRGHAPDIVTLQEFRRGSGEIEIVAGLKAIGLKYIHIPETQGHENTILIASKFGFDAGPFLPEPHNPLHMLEAYFSAEQLGSNRTENRFRYDQVLASPVLDRRLKRAVYDHLPRRSKISDHSAIIVEL